MQLFKIDTCGERKQVINYNNDGQSINIIFIVPIRLVDGPNQHAGRVEVYAISDGVSSDQLQWGTICDDYWDIDDARVVCRQLGFLDALAAPQFSHYGEGTGPILLDDVHCLGSESDLLVCEHNGIGSHNCFHFEDASVECLGNWQLNLVIII